VVLARLPLLTLVAMMMDYMLPKRVMSWKEAWEIYFEQNGGALFKDLARYGIRMPRHWETTVKEKDHMSHQAWSTFYQYAMPRASTLDALGRGDGLAVGQVPGHLRPHYRPRYALGPRGEAGPALLQRTLPMLCQTCQIPLLFTEPDDPTTLCHREERYKGEKYHFCSDGCRDIFGASPRSTSRPGCRCTRSTRATASGPRPTRRHRTSTRWPRP
jgi:phenol hydroxylase P3 protein